MNFRLTAILFGSILVVGVVLLVLSFTDDKPQADVLLEELAARPEDVTAVEMEKEGGSKLRLVRVGKDRWDAEWDAASAEGKDRQPVRARADAAAVNQLVAALLKAKPVADPSVTSNPAIHGLQPPGLKVTLHQGERSAAINFGEVAAVGGADATVYVTTSTRPGRPMATPRGPIEPLFRSPGGRGKVVDLAKWASDFRVKSVFAADTRGGGDDVATVSLTARGKTLALEKVGSAWKFTTPAGWGNADVAGDASAAPGTFTGVRPLLGALTSLQAAAPTDFVENPTAQQLADYGLNPGNPDAVRVELKTNTGETTVAYIGKKDTTPPAPGVAPSNKVWVRVEGQPGVVRASGGDLAGLAAVIDNPDPLRDRTLLAVDRSRIDGVDISGGVKLRRTGPEWKLFGPPTPNEPQPTNAQVVSRLLDALAAPRTIRSFPATNDANFAPNVTQAEMKVWADAFETPPPADAKAEPKLRDKAQPTTLIFGRREGDSIFVRRILPDGARADFLVPEKIKVGVSPDPVDLMGAVAKGRLDLLDGSLKTFAPEAATRVAVTGVANYDLTKDEKKDPSTSGDRWTFAAPADKKGQTADAGTVAEMLRILGTTQSVTRFVTEAPSPEQLIEYGLAAPAMPPAGAPPAPRLKVVIGLKDAAPAEKERVYEFGKETADPNYVYVRQAGRAAVFTLPRLVYDRFATPDLRDRVIYRFDPSAVTAVEFEGWGKAGFVTKLHAEKNKDGVWAVKSPPSPANFALDPNKVTAFLNALSKTPAKSFVPGPPAEPHGFGNDKEKLMVTIRFGRKNNEGDVALNLGAPAPDGQTYYGWTTALPQTAPVYTVDAAPFKPYKESPGAFAR